MKMRHVEDLVDGYLLGALEPAEAGMAGAHVDSCVACRQLLRESRQTIALLPESVEEMLPRTDVKLRLMSAVRAEVRAVAAPPRGPASMLPFRMDLRSSNRALRWASLGVAAAFIFGVVGGLAGWALILGDRLNQKDDDLVKGRDALETLLHSDHQIRIESHYRDADVTAVLALPSGEQPLLLLSDAPRLPTGEGYHVWLIGGGTPVSAGVLEPNDGGDATKRIDADLSKYERMEIDAQPASASAPGGERVLEGALR